MPDVRGLRVGDARDSDRRARSPGRSLRPSGRRQRRYCFATHAITPVRLARQSHSGVGREHAARSQGPTSDRTALRPRASHRGRPSVPPGSRILATNRHCWRVRRDGPFSSTPEARRPVGQVLAPRRKHQLRALLAGTNEAIGKRLRAGPSALGATPEFMPSRTPRWSAQRLDDLTMRHVARLATSRSTPER